MASKANVTGLRRGQVRMCGGRGLVLLCPSQHKGEWVVAYQDDAALRPAETRQASTLRGCALAS